MPIGQTYYCCILFHFYIKPQLNCLCQKNCYGCILFHFYIKPQPKTIIRTTKWSCILFHFYIKPQPHDARCLISLGCILFHFYIKPQLFHRSHFYCFVVSYSISTSNHNERGGKDTDSRLYLIPFLHQTTTISRCDISRRGCILFHFYIKPQLIIVKKFHCAGCILFHFYIKPQLKTELKCSLDSCILFHFYIKPQRNNQLNI